MLKGWRHLFFPDRCRLCQAGMVEGGCLACLEKVGWIFPPFCRRCGRRKAPGACPFCPSLGKAIEKMRSVASYHGLFREMLHQFKFEGVEAWRPFLSFCLIQGFNSKRLGICQEPVDCVVPIPARQKAKGEHNLLLSQALATHFGWRVEPCLARCFATFPQFTLPRSLRFQNQQGSFQVDESKGVAGKRVLLLDDILTTGATVANAALALKQRGAARIIVLTLAQTPFPML